MLKQTKKRRKYWSEFSAMNLSLLVKKKNHEFYHRLFSLFFKVSIRTQNNFLHNFFASLCNEKKITEENNENKCIRKKKATSKEMVFVLSLTRTFSLCVSDIYFFCCINVCFEYLDFYFFEIFVHLFRFAEIHLYYESMKKFITNVVLVERLKKFW